MIEVKNLTKHFADKKAVNNISFTVQDGEILGFLGPNGAGKSTTMNMLTGYISSTDGTALINGIDIFTEPQKAKAQIGYLPEIPPLYLDMTVKEYLCFMFDLKKCKLPRNSHLKDICNLVKITDVYGRLIKNLSKGYKQRVGLAQALIGNPPVLILDEPTVGLDPSQIIEIRTLIKKLGKTHTVILSSHILPEVQAVCDRIIIINGGKIVADDTTSHLAHSVSNDNKLIVTIDGAKDEVIAIIKSISGVKKVTADIEREKGAYEYEIETVEGKDIRRALSRALVEKNHFVLALRNSDMTLEDVFLSIVSGKHDASPVSHTDQTTEKPDAEAAEESVEDTADSEAAGNDDNEGGEE